MQFYQKFMVEIVALASEMNRLSGDAKDGMVPVDARHLNTLVRIASTARGGFNKHLEFATEQAVLKAKTRYAADVEEEDNGEDGDDTELQPEGHGADEETDVQPVSEVADDAGGEDRRAL